MPSEFFPLFHSSLVSERPSLVEYCHTYDFARVEKYCFVELFNFRKVFTHAWLIFKLLIFISNNKFFAV